jgi:hypothetical protein
VSLCECGCGGETKIAVRNHTKSGAVRGQPHRYIVGHHGKQSNTYFAIHKYLRRTYPKTGACDECGRRKGTEYALIHGCSYSRNRQDYRELCKACHRRYDQSELDWAKVAEIQCRNAAGVSISQLAGEYGVDHQSIRTALAAVVPSPVFS